MTPTMFDELVKAYMRVTGGSESSGDRTPEHNAAVGGVKFSAHQVGLGRDVVYHRPPTVEVRREWARRLGLRLVVEPDHDHLQPASWEPG